MSDDRPEPPWEAYEGVAHDDAPAPNNVLKFEPPPPERGRKIGRLTLYTEADVGTGTPRDYYLKGLISPGELSVFYGEPGCGKSFFVVYITRAIAQQRAILGRRVKGTNILFMALEGATGFENRLKAEIALNQEAEGFGYIAQPVNLFSDGKAREEVIEAIRVMDAGVLAIDTLNRAMPGASENDPADMSQFISNLDGIRAATGCHIIIVHHSGKDATRGMRGHSALLGAADVVVEVTRDATTKDRAAKVMKAKDDADDAAWKFALKVHDLGTDDDGDPITTCTVEELDHSELTSAKVDKSKDLKPEEWLWFDTIKELFAREENVKAIRPERNMKIMQCVSRDTLREWIKTRGLVGLSHANQPNGILPGKDRNKFARILSSLKHKKKLGVHGDWIWIL